MAQQRLYASRAERQAAYRRRREEALASQWGQQHLPGLPVLQSIPGTVRWKAALASARDTLQMVHTEMQQYFDERTERWQQSERAEAMETQIQALEDLIAGLDEVEG